MEKNIVFHGSNIEVSEPRILQHGFYKDFGYGFYCTRYEKQAKRWALTKRGPSIVNKYGYTPIADLKFLQFKQMTDEWIDFIAACRKGIEHTYDIVEGPMADDQIWNFVEDFLSGKITRAAFWELAKFKYPTHQIAFCTEKALKSLTFEGSESI